MDSQIGSSCHRVVQKARRDVLVLKRELMPLERIVVGVDGSPYSLAAVERAVELGQVFQAPVEAVAVYDPYFHISAFHSIAGVLSEEAGKVFRFKDQEKLHDEIINQGLEKIYRGYLGEALALAQSRGGHITPFLLTGKPFARLLRHVQEGHSSLLLVGRYGLHRTDMLDIGSTAENLLRLYQGNMLVINSQLLPPPAQPQVEAVMSWTHEAKERLMHVPSFARGMARKAIEDYAWENGMAEVTEEVMVEARERLGM